VEQRGQTGRPCQARRSFEKILFSAELNSRTTITRPKKYAKKKR
jgi:hypothetical protein